MLQTTFRPIQQWPRDMTRRRRRSPFKASYSNTLNLLAKELRHLGAREVVLQLALDEGQILQDGSRPYANASPRHPGVIIAFQSKHGPLQFACDEFTGWQDNLRGVALTLERLRLADLYGVTRRGEQYTGWKALPPGADQAVSRQQAVDMLIRLGGIHLDAENLDADSAKAAFRSAARRTHPDQGGNNRDFQAVMKAAEVLGLRGGA